MYRFKKNCSQNKTSKTKQNKRNKRANLHTEKGGYLCTSSHCPVLITKAKHPRNFCIYSKYVSCMWQWPDLRLTFQALPSFVSGETWPDFMSCHAKKAFWRITVQLALNNTFCECQLSQPRLFGNQVPWLASVVQLTYKLQVTLNKTRISWQLIQFALCCPCL